MSLKGDYATFESFDGTRITYASWGDGPALVLANGILCSDTYWTYLEPFFVDRGYRVVFFDYRGHNRSGRPINPNEVTVPSHARDLWEVADRVGVDEAVLIGHSMGVQTNFEAYRLQPSRVKAIVALTGPFEHPLDHLFLTPFGSALFSGFELTWGHAPTVVRSIWELAGVDKRLLVAVGKTFRMVGKEAPEEVMQEYFTNLVNMDPILVLKLFRGMQMHSARDIMGDIDVPVLVLAGRKDVLTPLPVQREMESLISDCRFCVMEDEGHTLPVENPDLVHAEVTQFLDDIGYAPEGPAGEAPTEVRRTLRSPSMR